MSIDEGELARRWAEVTRALPPAGCGAEAAGRELMRIGYFYGSSVVIDLVGTTDPDHRTELLHDLDAEAMGVIGATMAPAAG